MVIIANLPDSALADRFIPKEKFYQIGRVSHSLRQLFIDEVERITLHAVIAPRTMNISEGDYEEMHVIEIKLKGSDISPKVLQLIDSVIPRPVLFTIVRASGQTKYAISYKEHAIKDPSKSKVVHHYSTRWGAEALDLEGNSVKSIYINLIQQIEPSFNPAKPLAEAVQDTKQRQQRLRQIDIISRKITREPSVAKKQELARERHRLEQDL